MPPTAKPRCQSCPLAQQSVVTWTYRAASPPTSIWASALKQTTLHSVSLLKPQEIVIKEPVPTCLLRQSEEALSLLFLFFQHIYVHVCAGKHARDGGKIKISPEADMH